MSYLQCYIQCVYFRRTTSSIKTQPKDVDDTISLDHPAAESSPVKEPPAVLETTSSRKRKSDSGQFEAQLLQRWDEMIEVKKMQQKHENRTYNRFAEEVAEGVAAISDPYARELAMRDIRDIIFKAKYPVLHNN